jgi:hypothetical protein
VTSVHRWTSPCSIGKLAWLKQQPDVAVASVTALATSSGAFDIRRYAGNQPFAQEQLVPPFIRGVADTPYYASTSGTEAARQRRLAGSIGTYLLAAIAGIAAGLTCCRRSPCRSTRLPSRAGPGPGAGGARRTGLAQRQTAPHLLSAPCC